MHQVDLLLSQCGEIEEKLGYPFANRQLLVLAFVHRSYFNEHRDLKLEHNERLEFLGDSVLGLLISDYLYAHLPTQTEGHLSQLRAYLVEASSCVEFLQKLDVAQYILLGKGERLNDGRGRETILADLFEALLGAIYLDGGIEAASRFFLDRFGQELREKLSRPFFNWKAEFQDYAQKKHQRAPGYRVLSQSGPDHSKIFHVAALIGEEIVGEGEGGSKKEAEQAAAKDALNKLGIMKDG